MHLEHPGAERRADECADAQAPDDQRHGGLLLGQDAPLQAAQDRDGRHVQGLRGDLTDDVRAVLNRLRS